MKNKKGFSIIEVIIALGVITIALLGISSLNIQTLQAQRYSREYFLASILAQEAVELIRNTRDTNWILEEEDDWALSIDDVSTDGDYIIDYDSAPQDTFDAGGSGLPAGARLYIDADGYYGHTVTANPTSFYRYVEAFTMPDGGVRITITVQWSDRGRVNDYVVETFLYNWR